MIINGKQIAEQEVLRMQEFVQSKKIAPRMIALAIDPDAPTQQFLRIKARVAERVGIVMETILLDKETSQSAVEEALLEVLIRADGVVLQLPLPPHIDVDRLLALVPADLDPDCIGTEATRTMSMHAGTVLPPVISALRLISALERLVLKGKRAVVVGQGRLVGVPGALWLEGQGAEVVRLTRNSGDIKEHTLTADILVLGAGAPGLITPDMVKEGVALFDAGTSEEGGRVVGDADPACSERASLFTPVPGGIGPIAVAELFGNLLRLRFGYTGYRE